MRILVVNAGSSSVKIRLLGEHDVVEEQGNLPAGSSGFDIDALRSLLDGWPRPDVVGHRIVHGGATLTSAVVIDASVEKTLRDLVELAPLHQPKSLAALDAVREVLPDVREVACFDTAFHATIPPAAATYAVPREWRERWAVRRYGFHGLSHAYCARTAASAVGSPAGAAPADLRVVTCHLGAGASLAAVVGGRCVDTTMGFTPLEGLVMATRSGSVDPGLVLWLEEHEHLSPRDVAEALEHRSGLLGLTGLTDMREIERRRASDPDVALGFDVYVHRLVASVAAMAASAGGIDVLAFTGGVGENSAPVRAAAASRLGFLGVHIDERSNSVAGPEATGAPHRDITAARAAVRTLVIPAREDLQIAHEVRTLLS